MHVRPRPKSVEVAQTLRDRGVKEHRLWGKRLEKWNDKDLQEFEGIKSGRLKPEEVTRERKPYGGGVKRSGRTDPKKIIRLSDGHVFPSIKACAEAERSNPSSINNLAKRGEGFKFTT